MNKIIKLLILLAPAVLGGLYLLFSDDLNDGVLWLFVVLSWIYIPVLLIGLIVIFRKDKKDGLALNQNAPKSNLKDNFKYVGIIFILAILSFVIRYIAKH